VIDFLLSLASLARLSSSGIMKLSTTLCFALVITLCYFATVDSTPIQKSDVSESKKEVGRQSGPVVSPAVPGGGDDDDDDDGKAAVFMAFYCFGSLFFCVYFFNLIR
jgi:hypothetical protein